MIPFKFGAMETRNTAITCHVSSSVRLLFRLLIKHNLQLLKIHPHGIFSRCILCQFSPKNHYWLVIEQLSREEFNWTSKENN